MLPLQRSVSIWSPLFSTLGVVYQQLLKGLLWSVTVSWVEQQTFSVGNNQSLREDQRFPTNHFCCRAVKFERARSMWQGKICRNLDFSVFCLCHLVPCSRDKVVTEVSIINWSKASQPGALSFCNNLLERALVCNRCFLSLNVFVKQ
jgi:hypothetical protein